MGDELKGGWSPSERPPTIHYPSSALKKWALRY